MACLDNYILVKGHCAGATATSGLYINVNLPGITLAKAANTAEGALPTGVSLLNQCIQNGLARTRQDLVTMMLGRVRFNQIVSGGQYGSYSPDDFDLDSKYLSGTATGRGLKVELRNDCKYSNIYVHRVGVIGKGSGSKTLTITDGITATNHTFTLTNQTITWVETKQEIESDLAHIKISDATFQPFDTLLNYSGSCGFCTNECYNSHSCNCSSGMNIYGFDGANTNSQTYGLIATIQTKCSIDKFFCEISHLESVAWATLYASGIEFLNYNLLTGRVNEYTIYDDEQASATVALWQSKYDVALKTLRDSLPKYLNTIDSCCLECDGSNWAYSHP